MNLSTEKKIMDLENRLVAAQGEGSGRDQDLGVIGYNLEWIYNEILLSSIEKNYVLILILQQNKGWKKNVHIFLYALVPMLYSGKKINK